MFGIIKLLFYTGGFNQCSKQMLHSKDRLFLIWQLFSEDGNLSNE